MHVIAKLLRVIICICSFFYASYVLCYFMYFLSKQGNLVSQLVEESTNTREALWSLLINVCILSIFILQHSLMITDVVKKIYIKLHIEDVERSIYNASSALALHYLIKKWQTMPLILVWHVDTSQSNALWLLFTVIHFLGWYTIYSGCIIMDISELAGIKQVYYKISGRPPAMSMKSQELRRYMLHMRHPSFTGFLLILWVHPIMSVDRLLLSSLFTIYMMVMWNIDQDDYNYHSVVFGRKQREISANQ